MRLLLDTNIYVYMVSDQKSLSKDVCAYLEDPENLKYLSIFSLQELIIAFSTNEIISASDFQTFESNFLVRKAMISS